MSEPSDLGGLYHFPAGFTFFWIFFSLPFIPPRRASVRPFCFQRGVVAAQLRQRPLVFGPGRGVFLPGIFPLADADSQFRHFPRVGVFAVAPNRRGAFFIGRARIGDALTRINCPPVKRLPKQRALPAQLPRPFPRIFRATQFPAGGAAEYSVGHSFSQRRFPPPAFKPNRGGFGVVFILAIVVPHGGGEFYGFIPLPP